jgi:hypothetical protein
VTEEAHRDTEPRDAAGGPGESKLAPEGNSNARFMVPSDQEERREHQSLDEPEARAGAVEGDETDRSGGAAPAEDDETE